jgi:hypothetical protein
MLKKSWSLISTIGYVLGCLALLAIAQIANYITEKIGFSLFELAIYAWSKLYLAIIALGIISIVVCLVSIRKSLR